MVIPIPPCPANQNDLLKVIFRSASRPDAAKHLRTTHVQKAICWHYIFGNISPAIVHHFNEIDDYRRLGGAQAIPNIQYEVLARLDAPPVHLLGITQKAGTSA